MNVVMILLVLAALICFLIDAFSNPTLKVKLTPFGLALLTLYFLLQLLSLA